MAPRTNSNNPNSSSDITSILAIPILVAFFGWMIWYLYGTSVLGLMFAYSPVPFEFFAQLPSTLFPSGAQESFILIAHEMRVSPPAAYGWDTFKQILELWGYVIRLLLIPILVVVAILNLKLPANYYYRRSLNMRDLAEQNKELFPCTSPALGKDLHKTFAFDGDWRVADDYIDFASSPEQKTY